MAKKIKIGNWELYKEISNKNNTYTYLVTYTKNNSFYRSKKWKMIFVTSEIKNYSFDGFIEHFNNTHNNLQKTKIVPIKPKNFDGYGKVILNNINIIYFVMEELDYSLKSYIENYKNCGIYNSVEMVYLLGSYLLDLMSKLYYTNKVIVNITPEIFMLKYKKNKIYLTDLSSVNNYQINTIYNIKNLLYTSVCTDINGTVSYKDNIESIMYMVLSFLIKLPWENDINIKHNIDIEEFASLSDNQEIGTIIQICKNTADIDFNNNYQNYIDFFETLLETKYNNREIHKNKHQKSFEDKWDRYLQEMDKIKIINLENNDLKEQKPSKNILDKNLIIFINFYLIKILNYLIHIFKFL